MDPLVTVHERTGFLRVALKSVLAQSFTDYEVIVADDSGTGAAREICAAFGDGVPIRYFANPRTLGIALSLRAALEKSRGRYTAILNDDDCWEPDFLARLVPPLEADSRRVLAFSDHWIISEDGEIDIEASDRNTARYGRATLADGDLTDTNRFVVQQVGVPLAMASVFRTAALNTSLLIQDVAGAYDFWISCLLAASGHAFHFFRSSHTAHEEECEDSATSRISARRCVSLHRFLRARFHCRESSRTRHMHSHYRMTGR